MYTRQQLLQRLSLPLQAKILQAKRNIDAWYAHWGGRVYVSFSGGIDSTALLHLVRGLYPDVLAVFFDTGVEYPEIRRFVRAQENVEIVRPAMPFKEVIARYGYPVAYKQTAQYIYQIRHTKNEALRARRLGENPMQRLHYKWRYLLDAPFEIGDGCCSALKKNPAKKYERRTKLRPMLGVMAVDSGGRRQEWLKRGCSAFNARRPLSWPLATWTTEDVWAYIHQNEVPYCSIYDMGYETTGCAYCLFGIHKEKEPNRIQRLKMTHPKLWRYAMDDIGLRTVCAFMNTPYE